MKNILINMWMILKTIMTSKPTKVSTIINWSDVKVNENGDYEPINPLDDYRLQRDAWRRTGGKMP